MSMVTTGAYFKALREGSGLSPAELAVRLKDILKRNVDTSTIWRVENGKMVPSADLFMALIKVLSAREEDLDELFFAGSASESRAQELAKQALQDPHYQEARDQFLSRYAQLSPEQRESIIRLIETMR